MGGWVDVGGLLFFLLPTNVHCSTHSFTYPPPPPRPPRARLEEAHSSAHPPTHPPIQSGRLVLGSAGIEVRGLGIQTAEEEVGGWVGGEGWVRRGRDGLRAWWWVVGGWEGRGVVGWVHPTRRGE